MSRSDFRIGTRGSPLAVTQASWVEKKLESAYPKFRFSLNEINTAGDIAKETPIGALNMKGVFTKELDEALLSGSIEIAVHSLKDLSSELPRGLELAAVTECLDPRDALISRSGKRLKDLPQGAVVGTSSLRRRALLQKIRADFSIEPLRGNIETRIRKLDEGKCEAILLAAAGLKRMNLDNRVTEYLDPFQFIPAVGQGKLAIVTRSSDSDAKGVVLSVNDSVSAQIAKGERRFMWKMEGGCQIPLGCYGQADGGKLKMIGFLASEKGDQAVTREVSGELADAEELGESLAEEILRAFR